MSNNGKGLRTEVLVALIGLVGVVAVALIENWDKIFSKSSPAPESQAIPSVASTSPPTPLQSPLTKPTEIPDSPNWRSPLSANSPFSPREAGLSGFSEETDRSLNGCTITIDRPLVRLMSEASKFSPSVLAEVKPGSYSATVYRLVSIGGGAIKEGWFQAQVEGRIGWIDSDQISAKTGGCP